VEQAIFKVYKYVLSKHSTVMKDMMYVSGDNNDKSGTDENPLLLVGDSVEGWELFLSIVFPDVPTKPVDVYNDSRLYKLFSLVHKYSMELIERDVLGNLEN
ncbi:17336_t:CDS:2, partial [Acaulospora colombiana]